VADFLYQQPVNTYQAYNNYPGNGVNGKSLYDYNSYGNITVGGDKRAVTVSFDRPYSAESRSKGAGEVFDWEVNFIRWAERMGYDITYQTDVDTNNFPDRLMNYKSILSVGHNEYFTLNQYDAFQNARDSGVNLAFFGANNLYQQVHLILLVLCQLFVLLQHILFPKDQE
jgi:hypothetical protein